MTLPTGPTKISKKKLVMSLDLRSDITGHMSKTCGLHLKSFVNYITSRLIKVIGKTYMIIQKEIESIIIILNQSII